MAPLYDGSVGTVGGWRRLARLGVAPPWHHGAGAAVVGSAAMAIVCIVGRSWPLWAVVLVGAAAYGLVWRAAPRGGESRRLQGGFAS